VIAHFALRDAAEAKLAESPAGLGFMLAG